MKILQSIAFCLIATFLLTSCGDEDSSSTGLDGEWTAISFEADVESSSSTEVGGTVISISSESTIEGLNLDYDLELNDGNFTTNGSYSTKITTTSNQLPAQESTTDLESVMGTGTYTNTDTDITITGQFFDVQIEGMAISEEGEPSMANYVLDGDNLTFSQNETMITMDTINGIISNVTTTFSSQSVWKRK